MQNTRCSLFIDSKHCSTVPIGLLSLFALINHVPLIQVVDSLGTVARRQLLEEFVQTQLVAYDGECK